MLPVLKIMLFPVLAGIACILGFKVYRYFNEKIKGSKNLWQLVLYALSLIIIYMGIIIAGVWALLQVYKLLR